MNDCIIKAIFEEIWCAPKLNLTNVTDGFSIYWGSINWSTRRNGDFFTCEIDYLYHEVIKLI